MVSLTELFNPTFFMFLGILVLVVALIVVYFETKMREQNHKISSMFSIVSTLAEDMNGMKIGLNQIAAVQFGGRPVNSNINYNPLEEKRESKLITVSDDEESDSDDESIGKDTDDSENNDNESIDDEMKSQDESYDDESEQDDSEEDDEKITVLKLNISKEQEQEEEDEEEEELHSELSVNLEEIDKLEEIDGFKDIDELEELKEKDVLPINISDLKKININLEETNEKIDYKKLQLPKLRSIVLEKGLINANDASKLKKGELLKLLGIE